MHFYKSDGISVGAIYRFCEPPRQTETTFFCGGGGAICRRPSEIFSFLLAMLLHGHDLCRP